MTHHPAPLTLDAVREIARAAHRGQVDKLGRDYFDVHVSGVASRLEEHGPEAVMAGLLHDVLEDTELTAADLLRRGVPSHVVRAVEAVSKVPGKSYADLIRRAAADPLGRLVKLADNAQNLADNHLLAATDPDAAARLRIKYATARKVLMNPSAARVDSLDLSLVLRADENRWADLLATLMAADPDTAAALLGLPEGELDIRREENEIDFVIYLEGVAVGAIEAKLGDSFQSRQLQRYEEKLGTMPDARASSDPAFWVLAPQHHMPSEVEKRSAGATQDWRGLSWESCLASFASSATLPPALHPIVQAWRALARDVLPVAAEGLSPESPWSVRSPTGQFAGLRERAAEKARMNWLHASLGDPDGLTAIVLKYRTQYDLAIQAPTADNEHGVAALISAVWTGKEERSLSALEISLFVTSNSSEDATFWQLVQRLSVAAGSGDASFIQAIAGDRGMQVALKDSAGAGRKGRERATKFGVELPAGYGVGDGDGKGPRQLGWKAYSGARYRVTSTNEGLSMGDAAAATRAVAELLRSYAVDIAHDG